MPPRPRNNSEPRRPHWTGKDGEWAIIVSRGEPRRSNLDMERTVARMTENYLAFLHKPVDRLVLALGVQLIAIDHITPVGSQGVMLKKEHLRAYLDLAKKQVGTIKKGERRA